MTGRQQCLSSLLHLLHLGFWGDGGVLSSHCPSNMLKEPRADHQGVPGQLPPPLGRAAGRCYPGCSSLSDQALQPKPGRTRWASPGEQVSSWSCWVTLTPPPFRHCPISVASLPQPPPGLSPHNTLCTAVDWSIVNTDLPAAFLPTSLGESSSLITVFCVLCGLVVTPALATLSVLPSTPEVVGWALLIQSLDVPALPRAGDQSVLAPKHCPRGSNLYAGPADTQDALLGGALTRTRAHSIVWESRPVA